MDWVDAADFQDTLEMFWAWASLAHRGCAIPTSGYEYPTLNSTPEPSTFFLARGVVETCFLANVYRVVVGP